jgi:hypothetical protein
MREFGLWTVNDIASEGRTSARRTDQVLEALRLDPVATAGTTRLYSEDQAQAALAEMRRRDADRAAGRRPLRRTLAAGRTTTA